MAEAFLATIAAGRTEDEVIRALDETLRGRVFDAGEVLAQGIELQALREVVAAAGLAPDTAVRVFDSDVATRGALSLHAAMTAILAGTSELALALSADQTNGRLGAAFASSDYYRYSTAQPAARVRSMVVAGYDHAEVEQGVRSAVERSLVRAELRVEDLHTVAVAASDTVLQAVRVSLDGSSRIRSEDVNVTPMAIAAVQSAVGPLRSPSDAGLVVVEDGTSAVLCTMTVVPAGVEK